MMNSDLAAEPYYGSCSKVKVVEYLECSMSKGLLCKFPDNSPFDFDYSQSSIWSPLIRRPSSRNVQNSGDGIPENPAGHDEDGFNGLKKTKSLTVNVEKEFTDSSFDFDDSQSSIWSPLIPRPSTRNLLNSDDLPEKPALDDDDEFKGVTGIKALTANIKRKFTDTVKDNLQMYQNLKKRKRKSQEFSPLPRTPGKGWGKVLRAASKQFKKMKKKDGSIGHMNFRRCITGGG
ncbi:OLC1v1004192C1 [Oldenlandia corymbosa var. corymbosa]|uniref:OLC1v1004192C1 n=1 Tax=Oldenlandia corymbosa var. corymbosa TaxID=529605 RepID=A0AAV1DBP4_OLDCO|nr:OLC1v1004192C1 [Oldenlandia corymbosa var. corymbosa]